MNLRTIDPNGAYVEAVTWLVVEMMDPKGQESGAMIPWRTGPDGEVGVPLRLVAQATGRLVEEMEQALSGQQVMGEDAIFTGRQGARERLSVGAMADEACVNLIALPSIVTQSAGGLTSGKLIGVQAATVADLLERLAGVKAATASRPPRRKGGHEHGELHPGTKVRRLRRQDRDSRPEAGLEDR